MKQWINRIPELDLVWILRYWLGAMMIYHSYWAFFEEGGMDGFASYLDSMGLPYSFVAAVIAKSSEFFGGVLLILSIGTRLVSLLIFCVMSIAVFYAHDGLIWSDAELAFNYWIIALIMFFNPKISFQQLRKII